MLCLNVLEDILEGPLDDTLIVFHGLRSACLGERHLLMLTHVEGVNVENGTLDRESLTSTGLAVSEYGTIVALHAAVSYWLCDVIEDGCLVDSFISYEVETELLRVEATLEEDGSLVNLDAFRTPLC